MSLDTDLSRSPYFDTYTANNGHYQVLFRPSVAVQTRELNETQSIAQDQINKFGRQIFTEGSVVEGCQLSFDSSVSYIKLVDTYANTSALTVTDLKGLTVRNDVSVEAKIIETVSGAIARSPDLNTIYIKYVSASANGSQNVFLENETLTFYTSANIAVGQVVVANASVSGASGPTGSGYIVHAQEGVIFQKGYFVKTQPQNIVLTKYTNNPTGVSVGYSTIESIETPESNTSLLDNAAGAPNYAAPGAHRLKLTPILVSRSTHDTANTQSFFSIADFVEGNPSIVRTDPSYANLGKQLAQRTYDESGNYVISPFNIRLGTKYDANGDIVGSELKLEIDPGLAYVNGYRVETVGKLVETVRRGNDIKSVPQQIITATMGSYVFVNQYAGIFDTPNLQSVSLRSSTGLAVNSTVGVGLSVNNLSPPGSEIGTANVLAVELDTGFAGDGAAIYRLYLFNIRMNSGQSFNSVRCISATDGSNEAYADIVLTDGSAVLQESNLQALTFPFNQKAVKSLYAFTANNQTQFDYRTSNNVTFGTAGNAALTVPSRTGGTNQLPYSGTLSNNQEEEFLIIPTGSAYSTNIAGSVTRSTSNTLTGLSTNFTSSLAVGQSIRIANATTTEVVKISAISSATSLSTATNITNAWSGANVAWSIVPGDVLNISSLSGATISSSGSAATIDLGRTFNTSFGAKVYYNVRRTVANPSKKTLYPDTYVKIDAATSGTSGPWCLGYPDVLRIKHIYVGTTYSTANPDLISSFRLDNGQRDNFYDLAYLYKKTGVSIPANAKLLIQLDAFKVDSSQGIGFFSVDSYPVDDTGVTANTILTQQIPVYNSETSGFKDLRSSVDFRVQATNTAVYTTDASLANVNPISTVVFNSATTGFVPTPDSAFEADLDYYVGRYDKVGIDARGNVKVLEGAPSENPVIPQDIPTMMTLAVLNIPPYPSLASSEAATASRYDFATGISYYKNRRYTMRDIGTLDRRITQLEYYTSLSTLELSTRSLLIPNSTGGNRFQHGILADAFIGHDIGNTFDPQYNIAVDSNLTEARPFFQTTLVDTEFNSALSSGVEISTNGRLITLTKTEISNYIAQPFASKIRNCSQDVNYVWKGSIQLSPEGDFEPDVTINPAVSVNLDLYSNWLNLDEAWGTQWGTWREISSSSSSRVTGTSENSTQAGNILTTTIATTTQTTTLSNQNRLGTNLNVSMSENQYDFGSYVTDLNIQPFLRPKLVRFYAAGLKPNTIFYAFFDEIAVSQFCVKTDTSYVPTGTTLQTSSAGELYGVFAIPVNTFYVGERVFKLVDVANLVTSSDNIQSQATTKYFGTNVSYAKNNIGINTTEAQLSFTNLSENQVITTTNTATNFQVSREIIPNDDPIIQTFTIDEPSLIPGIFVSSIDVCFNSKDPILGVTLEIRTVLNGYPGYNVVPFSRKHLNASEVIVSSDGTAKTRFTFDAPVFLENNNDFAFSIKPDGANPNYTVWVGEIGGIDISTNAPIFNNSGVGVMFTSSDNRTWTPYQREDIKFFLNRATFSPLSGTVVLNNDDSEYLTVDSLLGNFTANEKVYFSNNRITNTGNVSTSSTTITNVNTTGFSSNTRIYIQSNTGVTSIVRRVISVTNSTACVINAVPNFTDNNSRIGSLTANGTFTGNIKLVNVSNGFMVVANSTANSSNYLTNNTYIIAESSNSSARVVSVDNRQYSVVMPKFSLGIPPGTAVGLNIAGTSNTSSIDTSSVGAVFEQETTFIDKERIVMSRTNEILSLSGNKSVKLELPMASSSEKISPIIDTVKAAATVIGNLINSDPNTAVTISYNTSNGVFNIGDTVREETSLATGTVVYSTNDGGANGTVIVGSINGTFTVGNLIKNTSNATSNVVANVATSYTSTTIAATERTPDGGLAISRYISKKVVLADGQDAEDLKVFVAAYKPSTTDILVYGKFWNSTDSEAFEEKSWTQLVTNSNLVSSKVNPNDFIEYVYSIPTTAPTDETAYLDATNLGIIKYTNNNGEIFDKYKAFAIKIVLLSSDSSVVPRIQDYRAIAVST